MSKRQPFGVRLCAWADAAGALRDVRRAVFVVEQGVPEALEFDAADLALRAEVELAVMAGSVGLSIGLAWVTGGLSAVLGAAEIAAMRRGASGSSTR